MSEPAVFDRIREDIGETDVVLFMKGTPVFPQCGFSAMVVQALSNLGVQFKGIDVLQDPRAPRGDQAFLELGRRSHSSTSRATSSAAATSCARCTRPAS